MSGYPTALAPQLNQVPEDTVPGVQTPTHGGMIVGHEYDMPIGQTAQSNMQSQYQTHHHQQYRDQYYYGQQQQEFNNQGHTAAHNTGPASAALPAPQARGPTLNSHRPRPVSMPPQSYVAAATPAAHATTIPSERTHASGDESKERRRHKDEHSSSRRSGRRVLGDYTLSKALGAGSMGQVRLATHNVTGEKLAVKILPRVNPNPPPQANGSSSNTDTQTVRQPSKDASKEIRTLREAALSMLLYHPYICGMREMIIHQHHYYMVFEYVNGGQMLDYIISHGRLRERVARKFARQIGSALMYCHLNNVVHRDLKIENILISQTGNIKIIDFGLSNLYDPTAHLSTFCGSLYFAAPELLSAKVYTGPEVDVWSFGVVIYVLVCGKVPFDDQSMPALHAKIKRGMAEYPVWLSAECKHLLSRMLVTNPIQRATLAEVMNHPWMVRGFLGPPAIHMVHREPLRADELDRQVMKNMRGFEFGTEDEIERKLAHIIESDTYQRAVQHWERKRSVGHLSGNGTSSSSTYDGTGFSNSSLAISFDSNAGKPDYASTVTSPSSTPNNSGLKKSKRFSGFDYYRRKLFSGGSSVQSSSGSGSTYGGHESHRNGVHAEREPLDPTQGFHPLVSMYYLAREKLERDRVYGPGQFASSQLSVLGDLSFANASSAITPTDDKSPTRNQHPSYANTTPAPSPSRKDPVPSTKAKADYSIPLPRLPAPETSHYSGMSYDTNVAAPSPTAPTFAVPNTPTPRARDPGAVLPVPPSPTVPASAVTSNSTTTTTPTVRQHIEIDQSATIGPKRSALPRAPPPSTHRRSHSMSQRPTMLTTRWGGMFGSGHHATDEHGKVIPEPPKTVGPDTSNFPISPVTDEKDRLHDHPSAFSGGATLVRKFGSMLVGGGDGSRRHHAPAKRATILGGMTPTIRTTNGATDEEKAAPRADKEKKDEMTAPNIRPSDHPQTQPPPPLTTIHTTPPSPTSSPASSPSTPRKSMMPPFATAHRRAATILDPQGRTIRHERRSSTSAALIGNTASSLPSGGTVGRSRRPSTGYSTSGRPLAERLFGPKTSEPLSAPVGGTESEMAEKKEEEEESGAQSAGEATDRDEDDRNTVKPVFLKGLFSVATTSTKQPAAIKADIRRVLDRMQVQYREIKTGFECIHLPSIDISSIEPAVRVAHGHHEQMTSSVSAETSPVTPQSRPSIIKKASKLSFGMKREKEKDKNKERDHDDKEKEPPGRPSGGAATLAPTHSSASSSFFNVSSNATAVPHCEVHTNGSTTLSAHPDGFPSPPHAQEGSPSPRSHSPTAHSTLSNKSKVLPPIPRDFVATSPLSIGRSPSPLPTGEVDKELFETMGSSSLSVKFEIIIVKVPFLPLHGIQFRRVGGDGWQYQMLARRVLTELKL